MYWLKVFKENYTRFSLKLPDYNEINKNIYGLKFYVFFINRRTKQALSID